MRVLLTGGAGDLGQMLVKALAARGDTPVVLDVRSPKLSLGEFFKGSILDRSTLAQCLVNIDCVVHIAAWHGIHEIPGPRQKNVYEFWDLNITGTFYIFEAAHQAGITNLVYISSTSRLFELDTIYGQSKLLGEEIAQGYQTRHGFNVITLRPRAFIPFWNRETYSGFIAWAKYFWGGATHIQDVTQGVLKSISLLSTNTLTDMPRLTLDSSYEYSENDFETWDAAGPGSTFNRIYPEYVEIAREYELDISQMPNRLGSASAREKIGYAPAYSLQTLLAEIAKYGDAGPPSPF